MGVLYSAERFEYHDGKPPGVWVPRYRGFIYKEALREWIADTSTLLVRKDLLYKVGLWDERVRCDEWDLCIRLALVADFDFIAEPLNIHYRHGGMAISKELFDRAMSYLDVITYHLPEIVKVLGRPGLAKHLSSVGKYFIQARKYNMAKACFKSAFRIWPFNIRPLANWLMCSLGPSAYFKLISNLKNIFGGGVNWPQYKEVRDMDKSS